MRKTVSLQFRNLIKVSFPGLGKNLSYWRFMRHLMFGRRDEKTGRPMISQRCVAKAEDKLNILENSTNYNAEKFLLKFQLEVMSVETFSWSDWSFKDGEARIAIVEFPQEIKDAIESEAYKMLEDRVYFDTGNKFSDKLQKVDRELIRKEAYTYFNFSSPEAKELLEYMNSIPVHSFSKVVAANYNAAWLEASNIKDPEKRRVQVEILNTIKDELQPFYKPSREGNTVRIFPLDYYSIPMLQKKLRKLITKGWYEFDLASSQLAIVGKTWEIPEVQEFLQSNKKIWVELINHYGFDANNLKQTDEDTYEDIKSVLKDALYSLIYGMGKINLVTFLNEGLLPFGIKDAGKKFFKHPLMKSLFDSRERKINELNDCDSAETIFGKVIKVAGNKRANGKPNNIRSQCIRSIMAQQAQAVELYLLLPVLDLAKSTNDFVITLWQHDGFSINFTSEGRRDRWINKINKVVNDRAADLGIITKLEGGAL